MGYVSERGTKSQRRREFAVQSQVCSRASTLAVCSAACPGDVGVARFLLTRLVGFNASAPPVKVNARFLDACRSAFGVGGIQKRVADHVRGRFRVPARFTFAGTRDVGRNGKEAPACRSAGKYLREKSAR